MPPKRSAGIVLFRDFAGGPQVLLGHPGGPFWSRRDAGAWSVPKGEYEPDEDPLHAARREFTEELGAPAPDGEYLALGEVTQRNGKIVTAWAVAGDLDPADVVSNTFQTQWPPRSGTIATFPELDRAEWFGFAVAHEKIIAAQAAFLDRLAALLGR